MTDAIFFLIDRLHDIFNVLAVDIGGVRLDLLIIFMLLISFFATIWFKGVKG